MSGLLLSSSSAAEVVVAEHDPMIEKLIGGPAIGRREFAQNERLALGRYLLRVEAAARGSTNGSKPAAAETVITITPPR